MLLSMRNEVQLSKLREIVLFMSGGRLVNCRTLFTVIPEGRMMLENVGGIEQSLVRVLKSFLLSGISTMRCEV